MPSLTRVAGNVDIRRLALIGAQARLAELNAERQPILKVFPEQSRSNPDGALSTAAPGTESARPPKRPRRKMSAEGRRRIAEAAKRRWAEWRKQNGQRQSSPAAGSCRHNITYGLWIYSRIVFRS